MDHNTHPLAESVSAYEGPICGVCHETYNSSDRIPRVVCSEIHNLCSKCLQDLLNKAVKKLVCPFCQSKKPKKSLEQYGVNRSLLESIELTKNLFMKTSSKKCCHCSDKEATRICLDCEMIACTECVLDNHDEHKKIKLTEVSQQITDKKISLSQQLTQIEKRTSGTEGTAKACKIKEKELMEEAHLMFEDMKTRLDKQKDALKKEINQKIIEIINHCTERAAENGDSDVSQWVKNAKNLTNDNITDSNRLICSLYKMEKSYSGLDAIKVGVNNNQEEILNGALNQLSLEFNTAFLENFQKQNLIKIQLNKLNLCKNRFDEDEEVKLDSNSSSKAKKKSTSEKLASSFYSKEINNRSESSDSYPTFSNYKFEPFTLNDGNNSRRSLTPVAPVQNQSFENNQNSEWRENGGRSEHPCQEDKQKLCDAFDGKLKVQVKLVKDSENLRLNSFLDPTNSEQSGVLKGDEAIEKLSRILSEAELASSVKKVSSLNLTCNNLTKDGILSLSNVIKQLPSLEVIRFEFHKTGDLEYSHFKPLTQAFGRVKNLSTLSLRLTRWKYMKNKNLSSTLTDLTFISGLKDLTLDCSDCTGLTTEGLMISFNVLRNWKSLEKLHIVMNGCINIVDDEANLKVIYQVYSEMPKLKEITFDLRECPRFTQRGKTVLEGPSKVNAALKVQVLLSQ